MPRIVSVAIAMFLAIVLVASSLMYSFAQSENVVWFIHGSGDDVIQIPDVGTENLLVARIHGNPLERHFSVTTYDALGNYTELLANTTDIYMGIVPFNFNTYSMQDVSNGLLEIKAEGDWTIEVVTLGSLPQAQNTQMLGGFNDYVGYVKGGGTTTALVTGNDDGRHFSVSAIGMDKDSGNGKLIVNTISPYEGTVRLPAGKEGFVLIVKAVGSWAIGFNTTDTDNRFFTIDATLKTNPYSPFKEEIANLTPAAAEETTVSTPVATTSPQAIAGSAKSGQTVVIVGKNADSSWLELADGKWIAAFLIDVQPQVIATSTSARLKATATSTNTKATPTKTPTPQPFKSGALGVDKVTFEKTHTVTGKDIIGPIYDDELIITFDGDGKIWRIEQWFPEESAMTPGAVSRLAAKLIPSDSVFVETYNPSGRPETTVNVYMSESLKSQVDNDWVGGEPGNLIIQYNTYDGVVSKMIISLGNNP